MRASITGDDLFNTVSLLTRRVCRDRIHSVERQDGNQLAVCKVYSFNILFKFEQDSAGFNKEPFV